MENKDSIKAEVYKSAEYLEKKKIIELEREVIELRHKFRIEEAQLERKNHHEEHLERMTEIQVKNENIHRAMEEKSKKIAEFEEKRQSFKRKW